RETQHSQFVLIAAGFLQGQRPSSACALRAPACVDNPPLCRTTNVAIQPAWNSP
ncbi:unnamed protein product, partial [Lampetra planeri]